MYQKLCVGEITNTHGIRGEVKVIPLTDEISAFDNIKKVCPCGSCKKYKKCCGGNE